MRRTWLATGALVLGAVVAAQLARPLPNAAAEEGKPAYIGADGCKKCHIKTFKSWGGTGMAKAFEALKPGQAAEKKTAAKLDPNADFTKDAKCLKCHVTAFGKDGGYPADAAANADLAKKTEGVTCEACHGPGSLYVPYKKEHEDFKSADLVPLGSTPIKADVCTSCHTKECPTMPADYAFDFAKASKDAKAIHEHVPLKKQH